MFLPAKQFRYWNVCQTKPATLGSNYTCYFHGNFPKIGGEEGRSGGEERKKDGGEIYSDVSF